MTTQEIIDYYTNLLIIQYNNKPKAKATIDLLVKNAIADNVVFDIQNGFNVDTAVGVQLDMIGVYVGIDRTYAAETFQDVFFGFSDYLSTEPTDVEGFSSASDFLTKEGKFAGASDAVADQNLLNDNSYRILIKLKIIQNTSNHSDSEIDQAIYDIFEDEIYLIDALNMTYAIFSPVDLPEMVRVAIQKGVMLKPMGVGLQGIIIDTEYFCFTNANGDYDSNYEGFSSASDFSTKTGEFLGMDNLITI